MIILVRHCYKLSLYAILRKANKPNSKNGQKPSARLNFSSFWPKFGPPPKKKIVLWVLSLLDVMNCCKI